MVVEDLSNGDFSFLGGEDLVAGAPFFWADLDSSPTFWEDAGPPLASLAASFLGDVSCSTSAIGATCYCACSWAAAPLLIVPLDAVS